MVCWDIKHSEDSSDSGVFFVILLASVLDERVTLARMNAHEAAPALSRDRLRSALRRACLLFAPTLYTDVLLKTEKKKR